MSDKNITPDQMQALLKFASKKLGTTPEKLASGVCRSACALALS